MATTLFDRNGDIITLHDVEDKAHWCIDGEKKEHTFIRAWGERIGYSINPEKKDNEFAPDLVNTGTSAIADLKSQHCPFFKAGAFYGIEPQYAVVFNLKDEERYKDLYPDIDVLFYIDWIAIKADINGKIYQVNPFMGIYKISFPKLLPMLKKAPVHEYINRRYDNRGNAKRSYVLDIRNPLFAQLA